MKRFFVIIYRILFTNDKFLFITINSKPEFNTYNYVSRSTDTLDLRCISNDMENFADDLDGSNINHKPTIIKLT